MVAISGSERRPQSDASRSRSHSTGRDGHLRRPSHEGQLQSIVDGLVSAAGRGGSIRRTVKTCSHDAQKREGEDEAARASRLNKGRGDPLAPGPCTVLL